MPRTMVPALDTAFADHLVASGLTSQRIAPRCAWLDRRRCACRCCSSAEVWSLAWCVASIAGSSGRPCSDSFLVGGARL